MSLSPRELDRVAVDEPRSRHRGRTWLVAGVVAAVWLALALAPPTVVVPDHRIEIAPIGRMPGETAALSFDEDVFATGAVHGHRWTAAASAGAGSASWTPLCIGLRLQGEGGVESTSTCVRFAGSVPRPQISVLQLDMGYVVAVVGYASEDVAALVWELPSGEVEVTLRWHADLPVQVFAAATRPGPEMTVLRSYDAAGGSLGGAVITSPGGR